MWTRCSRIKSATSWKFNRRPDFVVNSLMPTLFSRRADPPALPVLDKTKIPAHIAVIMDGNGRWAKGRRLPRIFGHKAGINSVREAVKCAGELGVHNDRDMGRDLRFV